MIRSMSTPPLVTSRTEGAVALVAFARPEKRNAISRDMLRASPLGQTEQFAKDFYDMVYKAVTERPGL